MEGEEGVVCPHESLLLHALFLPHDLAESLYIHVVFHKYFQDCLLQATDQ